MSSEQEENPHQEVTTVKEEILHQEIATVEEMNSEQKRKLK